jgi:glutamine phosphoribosylpyrophosphate amidotransferase
VGRRGGGGGGGWGGGGGVGGGDELGAANFTVEKIREKTGGDSLGYLSLDGLVTATGRERGEMCLGCLTGEYPNVPAAHQRREVAVG